MGEAPRDVRGGGVSREESQIQNCDKDEIGKEYQLWKPSLDRTQRKGTESISKMRWNTTGRRKEAAFKM